VLSLWRFVPPASEIDASALASPEAAAALYTPPLASFDTGGGVQGKRRQSADIKGDVCSFTLTRFPDTWHSGRAHSKLWSNQAYVTSSSPISTRIPDFSFIIPPGGSDRPRPDTGGDTGGGSGEGFDTGGGSYSRRGWMVESRLLSEQVKGCLLLSLYKIFVYFEARVHESTILSPPLPTCIAHRGAALLHDYWTV